jgi:hypothetical protein
MPFFSRPRHSTAVERRPVGYLPAFGILWLPRGLPRRLLSEAYQSSLQQSIPATVKSGSNTLQKGRSVKLLDLQFGYFWLPHKLSRKTQHCRSRAGAWHGMCELMHCMEGARHAMCESTFNLAIFCHYLVSQFLNTRTIRCINPYPANMEYRVSSL